MGIIRKRKERLEPCPAENREQCKFGLEDECKYDKKDCFLKKERENKKKCDKTHLKVVIFIAVGIILFLVSSILDCIIEPRFPQPKSRTLPLKSRILPLF